MADFFFLHSAGGSVYNLGSFLDVSEPLDLGFDALDRPVYNESPLVDGAAFGFESSGVRTWQLPLILPSGADAKSLDAFQAALRLGARPGGGKLVALPFGVASAEAVHFDLLAGRWRPAYHARERGVGRTRGTLELDTQPFGYWPTMILLASAASVGAPGMLAVPGASVIGDVPGLAEVFIAPTTATSYGLAHQTDALYWSLGAGPSVTAFWGPASALLTAFGPTQFVAAEVPTQTGPTLIGDQFAPASQALRIIAWTPSRADGPGYPSGYIGNVITEWTPLTEWIIPPTVEPGYRGRFRAYAWARHDVPTIQPFFPFQLSLDAQAGPPQPNPAVGGRALASHAPAATLPPAAASNGRGASPAYSLLDLGEIQIPPVASRPGDVRLRLWAQPATSNFGYATTATAALFIGGLHLQPLNGPAGIMPRGLAYPSWSASSIGGRLLLSAVTGDVTVEGPTAAVASPYPMGDGHLHYRGVLPLVGPTTLRLDLNITGHGKLGALQAGPFDPPVRSEPHFAAVSVRYRPRFTFAKTL